jgi:hypothetical protein
MWINWFTPIKSLDYNKNLASTWIRCLQLIPYLEKEKIYSHINSFHEDADVAIFVRYQNKEALDLAKKCKSKGQKIIADFCVNYLDVSGKVGEGYGSLEFQREEAIRMIEIADIVFCSSNNITSSFRKYHENVHYLSDSINLDHFKYIKKIEDFNKKKLNLMYAGVSSKTTYLFEHIYPLVRDFDYSLSMIMDKRKPLLKRYSYQKWNYESFPQELIKADLGLAPRDVESSYDLGHSIFKIGVFIAQGIPVLASPVPSYFEIIKDSNVGMICSSPKDWRDALMIVEEDRSILSKWSSRCHDVIMPYSTENIVKRYTNIFNGIKRD